MENWEKELKLQLETEIAEPSLPKVEKPDSNAQKPTPSPKVEAVKKEESGTWLFVVMLFILAATTLWVYDDKTGGSIRSSISSLFNSSFTVKPEEKKESPYSDAEVAKIKNELEKFKSENKSALDSIQAKLNTNSTKIGLMGLLINENFTMIMRGADSSDFVFFNRDWTLDREPRFIELTDDDKEYLKKYIKTKD